MVMCIPQTHIPMEEDIALQMSKLPPPGPGEPYIENVIMPIKGFSESTLLTNFDSAQFTGGHWFSFVSKYTLSNLSVYPPDHMGYIASLPSALVDEYRKFYGKALTAAVLTHFKRDLFHAIRKLLITINPKFLEAYEHGIVLPCIDDFTR